MQVGDKVAEYDPLHSLRLTIIQVFDRPIAKRLLNVTLYGAFLGGIGGEVVALIANFIPLFTISNRSVALLLCLCYS